MENLDPHVQPVQKSEPAGGVFPDWERYDSLTHSVGNYLNIKMDDKAEYSRMKDKIAMIRDYAKSKASSEDSLDILWSLRSLENRLGSPPLGEKRINYLYKWIRLEGDRARIEREQQGMERNYTRDE
jgi:hypothetical protein